MKMGVVGNREGFTYEDVKKVLDKYKYLGFDTIVTGGAKGVDTHAMRYAKENGLCLIVYYPDYGIGSPERYFIRNEKIVKYLVISNLHNMLIAFNKKEHSGTTNTIHIAERYGLGLKICDAKKE